MRRHVDHPRNTEARRGSNDIPGEVFPRRIAVASSVETFLERARPDGSSTADCECFPAIAGRSGGDPITGARDRARHDEVKRLVRPKERIVVGCVGTARIQRHH